MRVVIGLDQSTKTGYAIADAETGNIIKSGHFHVRGVDGSRLSAGAAFNCFERWLESLLEDYTPVRVVFEQPHFQGYNATVELVGFVAIILKVCAAHNIEVSSVHTATLKKFATGNGRADKGEMTAVASEILGRTLSVQEDNDEADAVHLVMWGLINGEKAGRDRQRSGRSVSKRGRRNGAVR